jgi:hypothetical protein
MSLAKSLNSLRIAPQKEAGSLLKMWRMLYTCVWSNLLHGDTTHRVSRLRSWKVRYRVQRSPLLDPVMSQMIPFHGNSRRVNLTIHPCPVLSWQCKGLNLHSCTALWHVIYEYLPSCRVRERVDLRCIKHLKVCHTLSTQTYERRVPIDFRYSEFGPSRILKTESSDV